MCLTEVLVCSASVDALPSRKEHSSEAFYAVISSAEALLAVGGAVEARPAQNKLTFGAAVDADSEISQNSYFAASAVQRSEVAGGAWNAAGRTAAIAHQKAAVRTAVDALWAIGAVSDDTAIILKAGAFREKKRAAAFKAIRWRTRTGRAWTVAWLAVSAICEGALGTSIETSLVGGAHV